MENVSGANAHSLDTNYSQNWESIENWAKEESDIQKVKMFPLADIWG